MHPNKVRRSAAKHGKRRDVNHNDIDFLLKEDQKKSRLCKKYILSYEILTMNFLLLREVFGNDDFLKNVFENIGKAESFAHWYYNSKGSAFCPQWNWEIIKYPLNRLAELQRVVQGFLN